MPNAKLPCKPGDYFHCVIKTSDWNKGLILPYILEKADKSPPQFTTKFTENLWHPECDIYHYPDWRVKSHLFHYSFKASFLMRTSSCYCHLAHPWPSSSPHLPFFWARNISSCFCCCLLSVLTIAIASLSASRGYPWDRNASTLAQAVGTCSKTEKVTED